MRVYIEGRKVRVCGEKGVGRGREKSERREVREAREEREEGRYGGMEVLVW